MKWALIFCGLLCTPIFGQDSIFGDWLKIQGALGDDVIVFQRVMSKGYKQDRVGPTFRITDQTDTIASYTNMQYSTFYPTSTNPHESTQEVWLMEPNHLIKAYFWMKNGPEGKFLPVYAALYQVEFVNKEQLRLKLHIEEYYRHE